MFHYPIKVVFLKRKVQVPCEITNNDNCIYIYDLYDKNIRFILLLKDNLCTSFTKNMQINEFIL